MIFVLPLTVAAAVCVIAVLRTRQEPRRLSNAYWLLAGGMLLINVLGSMGLLGIDLLFFLIALLALLSPLLASRIRAGMAEFARRQARILIMSGGKGSDELIPEAEAMAGWAIDNGADPSAVRTEIESRNTEQNLRFSQELVRTESATPGPGLIVTSNYHVLRAAILARKIGVDAQAAGAPTADYYWPSAMIREYVAILREQRIIHVILLMIIAVPLPLILLINGW